MKPTSLNWIVGALLAATAAVASAGPLDPDCTAEKAAKSAAMKATVGVGGRCDPKEAAHDTAKDVTDFHEDFFNVLFALILLHLAAIAFYLVVKRINLISPMLSGKRRGTNLTGPATGIGPIPLWRLALGVALAVGVVWLVAR